MDKDLNIADVKETCRELLSIAKNTHYGFTNQIKVVKKVLPIWFEIPSNLLDHIFNLVLEEEYGVK